MSSQGAAPATRDKTTTTTKTKTKTTTKTKTKMRREAHQSAGFFPNFHPNES